MQKIIIIKRMDFNLDYDVILSIIRLPAALNNNYFNNMHIVPLLNFIKKKWRICI